jgi:hypothetical protein
MRTSENTQTEPTRIGNANGYMVYQGPSMIDGRPIKAMVTGINKASDNRKTGDMLQLWIMPINSKPSDAVQNGDDASVCGECPHRPLLAKINGVSPCYVNHGQAPNSIYRATYPDTGINKRNAPMRLGAWGDPAALPFEVVAGLVDGNHTGYTHQWRTCDPRFKDLLMASVDSRSEKIEASAMGWRTFRVMDRSDAEIMIGEIRCPASKEAGNLTQCADCGLCAGSTRKAKDIAIINH